MADDHDKKSMEMLKISVKELKEILSGLLIMINSCITELVTIADELDTFHRGTTIASVTGSSVGILGGVTTLVGLALAPFTFGASLIVSGIGMGVAVAGGVTGAGASIADCVNMKNKCSCVEKIVNSVNDEMKKFEKASKKMEQLAKDLESKLSKAVIPEGVRVGGKGVYAALEIVRMIQLGKISTAAAQGAQIAIRGAQVLKVVSGVFAALFVVIDAVFLAKAIEELKKGGKTEATTKIRECAEEFKTVHKDLRKLDNDLVLCE